MKNNNNIPKSDFIKGLQWQGQRIPYGEKEIKGDTFPMTWAEDDEIYTAAGDPLWGETVSGLDIQKFSGGPQDYKISKVSHMNDYLGWGGDGPKPSGMICVDGVLYFAFQNMLRNKKAPWSMASQHGSDAHIIHSSSHTQKGMLWVPAFANIEKPMFPGNHFGGPAFINFGKNNANARDNYVYAVSSDSWDNGTHLRVGRVPNDKIIHIGYWEWVAAFLPNGEPVWHNDLNEAIPVLSAYKSISIPDMVYLKKLNRYLLLTWRLQKDFSGSNGTDLIIYESPEPWGPFSLAYEEEFWEGKEFNPYNPRIPLKWMEDDGVTGWMQFSGCWEDAGQKNGYYRSNVRKFKLCL